MKRHSLILFAAVALLATTALAQRPIGGADVPFAFTVGKTVLPAGHYRIDALSLGNSTLAISGRSTVMCLSNYAEAAKAPDQGKLVFNRYGDRYFLSEIWTAGDTSGRTLLVSKVERELALTSHPQRVMLALLVR